MTKLWLLLSVSLILSYIIERRDGALEQAVGRHERLFTFFLILLLAVFCGLRTWYNDTVTYLGMYEQAGTVAEFFSSGKSTIAGGWGFSLLNCIIKELGFSSQDYLMFYAFLTVTPYVLFVRKCCPHFVFGVFLMFTTGFYSFALAAIKQCMATGICLLAVMSAIDGKRLKSILFVGLAVLFHPYAIVYILIPVMSFRPWSRWTYVCIAAAFAIGFSLESLLDSVLDVTDMIGANYDETSFGGEGVNIFRVLVAFVPLVLSLLYRRALFSDSSKAENLIFNLAMLNALIMFVGLFGTANYFARLANYFLPAQVAVLPWILNKICKHDRGFWKTACVIGYMGYFYYENGINQNFDSHLSQISLWTYISDLF